MNDITTPPSYPRCVTPEDGVPHIMPQSRKDHEYSSIQLLRAIAASSVVAYHLQNFGDRYLGTGFAMPRGIGLGELGVDLFFLISGFIITKSTHGCFGYWRQANFFLIRRLARIYPIYWIYYFLLLFLYISYPSVFSGLRGKPDLISSFMLLPSEGASLLLVAWSLTFELQFYLLFTLALMVLPERRLLVAAGVWAAMIVARHLLIDRSFGRLDLLFDLFNLEFLTGCLLAKISSLVPKGLASLILSAGFLLLTVGCIVLSETDGRMQQGWPRILCGGGGLSLILLSAVLYEEQIRRYVPSMAFKVGASSYSLYLSHLLTIGLLGSVIKSLGKPSNQSIQLIAVISVFMAALMVGWFSFRFLEQPLLRLTKIVTGRSRPGPRPSRGEPKVIGFADTTAAGDPG